MGLLNQASNWARERLWNWLNEGRQVMLLTKEEKKHQSLIVLARRYYDGDHDVKLTKRQREWLDQHEGTVKFTINHCPTVVDAVVERLQVIGFDIAGEKKDAADQRSDDEGKLSAVAWRWWQDNRMDAIQTEGHRKTGIDGEAFILIAWNDEEARPDWVLHPRYVDSSEGGDGYGMWVEYPNRDPFQKPIRAIKQWSEETADGKTQTRRTVYYPDRIEKFVQGQMGLWEKFTPEGEEWPLPWKQKNGKAIGIPVVHLKNPGLKSELAEVIPLQDALNKSWLDLLAAEDSTAFRTLILLGLIPTKDGKTPKDDGSNLLKILPGQMWASAEKPSEVEIHTIDPASLDPLLAAEDRIVLRIASVSGTPVSRFLITRQV
ncbi:MAG: phage portal protein, partial [Acidobacteriales bacterium]|nr:phage portal protein [Terriglobales bacterium]